MAVRPLPWRRRARPDSGQITRMLAGLIMTALAESGGLEVVSTAGVRSALRQAGPAKEKAHELALAQEAAAETGAVAMLTGQLIGRQDAVTVSAELVDVGEPDDDTG